MPIGVKIRLIQISDPVCNQHDSIEGIFADLENFVVWQIIFSAIL